MKPKEKTQKIPVIEYVDTKIPKYRFVDEVIKRPKLVDVTIESVSAKDLELLKDYGSELTRVYDALRKIKNYKIVTEELRVKEPVFVEEKIPKPVFIPRQVIDVEIKEVVKEVNVPVFKDIKIDTVSKDDLNLIREIVSSLKELKKELDGLRRYKLREEIVTYEKPIIKPVDQFVDTERINWIVKDEVIDTLDDLVTSLKKKRIK